MPPTQVSEKTKHVANAKARIARTIKERVGDHLRQMYNEIIKEPLPPKIADLLRRLDTWARARQESQTVIPEPEPQRPSYTAQRGGSGLLAKRADFDPVNLKVAIMASREERSCIGPRPNFAGMKLPGCSNSPRDATTGRGRISSRWYAAILIRDLEPWRHARAVWDRAAGLILLAAETRKRADVREATPQMMVALERENWWRTSHG
jgi:hypothetical protein